MNISFHPWFVLQNYILHITLNLSYLHPNNIIITNYKHSSFDCNKSFHNKHFDYYSINKDRNQLFKQFNTFYCL